MVGSVVDGVDTNSIDAETLELLDVALATSNVGDGVLSIRCATWSKSVRVIAGLWAFRTWLVVDTTNVETLVASEESCTLSTKNPIARLVSENPPFPLIVTGVIVARFSMAAGEAATEAARTAAMVKVFIARS
jgi:hypothetical protein